MYTPYPGAAGMLLPMFRQLKPNAGEMIIYQFLVINNAYKEQYIELLSVEQYRFQGASGYIYKCILYLIYFRDFKLLWFPVWKNRQQHHLSLQNNLSWHWYAYKIEDSDSA